MRNIDLVVRFYFELKDGKSDPFCTLQLVNQMARSHTEYKTLNPEWAKTFEFRINDIHALLEINVFDEDKNKVYEFLGKVAIPLLNVSNLNELCSKRLKTLLQNLKIFTRLAEV